MHNDTGKLEFCRVSMAPEPIIRAGWNWKIRTSGFSQWSRQPLTHRKAIFQSSISFLFCKFWTSNYKLTASSIWQWNDLDEGCDGNNHHIMCALWLHFWFFTWAKIHGATPSRIGVFGIWWWPYTQTYVNEKKLSRKGHTDTALTGLLPWPRKERTHMESHNSIKYDYPWEKTAQAFEKIFIHHLCSMETSLLWATHFIFV